MSAGVQRLIDLYSAYQSAAQTREEETSVAGAEQQGILRQARLFWTVAAQPAETTPQWGSLMEELGQWVLAADEAEALQRGRFACLTFGFPDHSRLDQYAQMLFSFYCAQASDSLEIRPMQVENSGNFQIYDRTLAQPEVRAQDPKSPPNWVFKAGHRRPVVLAAATTLAVQMGYPDLVPVGIPVALRMVASATGALEALHVATTIFASRLTNDQADNKTAEEEASTEDSSEHVTSASEGEEENEAIDQAISAQEEAVRAEEEEELSPEPLYIAGASGENASVSEEGEENETAFQTTGEPSDLESVDEEEAASPALLNASAASESEHLASGSGVRSTPSQGPEDKSLEDVQGPQWWETFSAAGASSGGGESQEEVLIVGELQQFLPEENPRGSREELAEHQMVLAIWVTLFGGRDIKVADLRWRPQEDVSSAVAALDVEEFFSSAHGELPASSLLYLTCLQDPGTGELLANTPLPVSGSRWLKAVDGLEPQQIRASLESMLVQYPNLEAERLGEALFATRRTNPQQVTMQDEVQKVEHVEKVREGRLTVPMDRLTGDDPRLLSPQEIEAIIDRISSLKQWAAHQCATPQRMVTCCDVLVGIDPAHAAHLAAFQIGQSPSPEHAAIAQCVTAAVPRTESPFHPQLVGEGSPRVTLSPNARQQLRHTPLSVLIGGMPARELFSDYEGNPDPQGAAGSQGTQSPWSPISSEEDGDVQRVCSWQSVDGCVRPMSPRGATVASPFGAPEVMLADAKPLAEGDLPPRAGAHHGGT